MNKYKRVLVISNNCFSLSNSNGRTLGNLFEGWPKTHLAQMSVYIQDPNWDLCDNYYCIEDKVVLNAFLHFRRAEGYNVLPTIKDTIAETKRSVVGKKTIGKVILREIVWSFRRWESPSFLNWLDSFNPEVLVLQFGDSSFMLDIAYDISTKRNIPLVIYNTEGYYFFPRNWYNSSKLDGLLFTPYKKFYTNKVNRVMRRARHIVHLNDKLKTDYDNVFDCPSSIIYNSSSVEWSNKPLFENSNYRFCYLGNLGLDRDSALVNIGKVLNEISNNYKIEVYGQTDQKTQDVFRLSPGVDYKGVVSYDEVKGIMSSTDILFHVETETGYKERQLQYAFTTKIADSLASGRCFVVYAPTELACYKYVDSHKCGWVSSNEKELKDVICNIIEDSHQRSKILKNARIIAKQNHDMKTNALQFQEILRNV